MKSFFSICTIILFSKLCSGQICFSSPTNYPTGNYCYSVFSADFNGDGKNDIVSSLANSSTNNICVKLNNGSGTFLASTYFTAGSGPACVIGYDFNGDGKKDIATANQGSSNISILLGNGTGGFLTATNFSVGPQPYSVITGDFNGDGKIDLVSANYGANYLSLLLGNGLGSFSVATNIPMSSAPYHVTAGDFNGDGKLDLAATKSNSSTNNVAVFINNGSGIFLPPTYFTANINPISIDNDDFNNDGKKDLVVTNEGSNNVSLLLGSGTGSFSAATNFTVGSNPVSVSINDFNADGKPDLAVANSLAVSVTILVNNGVAGFLQGVTFSTGFQPRSIFSADLNGDAKPDLMTANFSSGDVSVLNFLPPLTQPGAISGNTLVAAGSAQTYSVAAIAGAISYNWTLPSGWTGGSPSNSISVTTGTISGTLSVTAQNSCGISPSRTIAVTVSTCSVPNQPATIFGNTTVPSGSSQTYSVSVVPNATSYNWTLPPGWTGNSTTNTISITTGTNGGTISVVAQNSCGLSSSSTLAVTNSTCTVPNQPVVIIGNTLVASNSIQNYSVAPVANATSYAWYVLPAGFMPTSTSNTVSINVGNLTDTLLVVAINSCGASTTNSLIITVNGCTAPGQPGVISGNTNITTGSSQTYSVAVVPNATSYNWTLPFGWTGSSITNTISLTAGTNGGTISVVAQNSCGVSPSSALLISTSSATTTPINQDWVWAKSSVQEYQGYAQDIATDALGNSYITGIFSSPTITFGSITLNKVSASSGQDVFIAKYDANGNAIWAKNTSILTYAPGSSIAIATDASNNVFITGAFNVASANFSGVLLSHSSSNPNSQDIFIVKYDSQGNLLWAKDVDYNGSLWLYDIAIDSQGNPLITGSFSSSYPLTFGGISLPAYSNTNPFVSKFDPSGNVIWAKGAQQTVGYASTVWSYGIATDANDNIYIVGDYAKNSTSTLTFDGHSLPVCNGRNMYIVKYDNLGNALWAKASIGTSYSGIQSTGFNITADLNGNIIITGSFSSATIGFGNITLTNSNSNNTPDIFVVKYDSFGNDLWAKNAGGMGDDKGHKISSDNFGNIYVTGYFVSKPASFGSFTINKQNLTSKLFFVVKYDNLGNEVWVKYTENTNADESYLMTNSVAADDFGNVYVTGNAYDSDQYGSAVFGNTTLTYGGIFIAKLGETLIGVEEINYSEQEFVLYPNPTTGIFHIKNNTILKNTSIKVFNTQAQTIFESTQFISEIDLSDKPKGIYFIQIKSEDKVINKKIVVQ